MNSKMTSAAKRTTSAVYAASEARSSFGNGVPQVMLESGAQHTINRSAMYVDITAHVHENRYIW